MFFEHDLRHVFFDGEGGHGLARAGFQDALARTDAVVARLKREASAGQLPHTAIAHRRDDIDAARPVAAHLLKNTSDLCLLGVGGSSLGAQALAQLGGWRTQGHAPKDGAPRFHAFDNLDGHVFAEALSRFDLRTTRFLAVSKSGTTAETLMQVFAAADALIRAGGEAYLGQHFAVITEPTDNPLRRFADAIGAPRLDHPLDIGGRYSVLTLVGMLPALLLGFDPVAIREAAAATAEAALNAPDSTPAQGAALCVAAEEAGLGEHVFFAYGDRLERFAAWHRQLWSESVGKNGKGAVMNAALGPVDQHSQLQLYLEGPNARLFTVLGTASAGEGPLVPEALATRFGAAYLGGRRFGDLTAAQTRATAETLARRGRPVRRIHLAEVNARNLGALFMHFMLETIIAAGVMGVDPFDQPAVEEGKRLARAYLSAAP